MTNWLTDKFHLIERLKLQPSEIDAMPFYEYLHHRKMLAEKIKAENEAHRRQQAEQDAASRRRPKPKLPKYNNKQRGSQRFRS